MHSVSTTFSKQLYSLAWPMSLNKKDHISVVLLVHTCLWAINKLLVYVFCMHFDCISSSPQLQPCFGALVLFLLCPRILSCCFLLRRRQISSDIISWPFLSTAIKTQTCKGLACRLNKSACLSGNVCTSCSSTGVFCPTWDRDIKSRCSNRQRQRCCC